MKQEQKDKSLKYLCMALPYGVICQGICEIWDNDEEYYTHEFHKTIIVDGKLQGIQFNKASIDGNICNVETVKPYLRPMSSMTEEEFNEWYNVYYTAAEEEMRYSQPIVCASIIGYGAKFDWLLEHHFDFMGLIDEELAISTDKFNPYKD